MAFSSRVVTVGAASATPLLVLGTGSGTTFKNIQGTLQDPLPVIVTNTGAATLFIGGSDVTNVNGFPLAQNQSLPMALYNPSEIPYAYSVAGTTVPVLVGRQ